MTHLSSDISDSSRKGIMDAETKSSLLRTQGYCPRVLTFTWWGCCGLCFLHKPNELAHSFLFCFCAYLCIHGPFNCVSIHKFSRQLSVFSLCSSGFSSALSVLWTMYLFVEFSFSPDIILCGWLGLKHQLTNPGLSKVSPFKAQSRSECCGLWNLISRDDLVLEVFWMSLDRLVHVLQWLDL